MRNAQQFHIGEHRARAQSAVVQGSIQAGGKQLVQQGLGGGEHLRVLLGIDHADHHLPRRHRRGPDDAGVVMVLFDRRGHDARNADAVAAHLHHRRLATFVDDGGLQRLRVLAAKLEYMAHLDAASQAQFAAIGRAFAFDHVAHIGHGLRFGQIAAPIDADQVGAGHIRADHKIGQCGDIAVGHYAHRARGVDRTQEARLAAEVFADLAFVGQAVIGQSGHLGQLDLVDRVIATHQHQHEAGLRHHRHRLDRALQRDAEQLGHVFTGLLGGRCHLLHRFAGRGARGRRCRTGGFHIGGVIGASGERQRVFAGVGDDVEFLRCIAADGAGICLHGAEVQSQAGEDARIGGAHVVVFARHVLVGEVERIRVLHQELARTHHAEARADLIAEFGLDLIEIQRQLLVAVDLLAREFGSGLFGGGAVAELLFLAVLDLEQLPAELFPTPGGVPQLAWLDGGKQHFHCTGAVHLLAHDGLDLAQHAQAQRRPGVQPGGQLADHARAQHQAVADQLGVGRGFLGGVQVELGKTHRASLGRKAASLPVSGPAGHRRARVADCRWPGRTGAGGSSGWLAGTRAP